jgi:hypothetical protein
MTPSWVSEKISYFWPHSRSVKGFEFLTPFEISEGIYFSGSIWGRCRDFEFLTSFGVSEWISYFWPHLESVKTFRTSVLIRGQWGHKFEIHSLTPNGIRKRNPFTVPRTSRLEGCQKYEIHLLTSNEVRNTKLLHWLLMRSEVRITFTDPKRRQKF